MSDKGMPLMDHDLHAVAAAVLVAMAYKFNILRADTGIMLRILSGLSQAGQALFY
jgi:hypothetical protein